MRGNTTMHRLLLTILFCIPASSETPSNTPPTLLQAIRDSDMKLIRIRLHDGAGVDARGKNGVTPLMQAAAFGTVDAMQMLIGAGADVNSKNAFDATALMWAAADLVKVKLLVSKGADVNARSKLGRTPLIVASSYGDSEEIVKLLIAHGADVKARDGFNSTALMGAVEIGNVATARLLIEKRAEVNARNLINQTALMFAAGNGDLATVRLLLKAGADVNAVSDALPDAPPFKVRAGPIALGKSTPLLLATTYGSPELIKTLLDAGADVNHTEIRGITPLMMAVTSESQQPAVVELLLARGADPKRRSLGGETAAEWAAKFGNPAVLKLLSGNSAPETAAKMSSAGEEEPVGDAAKAVHKSLELLQTTNRSFFEQSGCAGCHNQQVSALALNAARRRAIHLDEKAASEQVRALVLDYFPKTELLLQRVEPFGTAAVSFDLMALSAMDYPPDAMTDAMVGTLASQQRLDGSWPIGTPFSNARTPMQDGLVSITARDVLALREYGLPGRKTEFDRRRQRAGKWLASVGSPRQ